MEKFCLLLVGDRGHGVVSETGDAVGLLLTSKDAKSMKVVSAPVLSHFSINKLVRTIMAGECGSEEIPQQYCAKCRYNAVHFAYKKTRVLTRQYASMYASMYPDDATVVKTLSNLKRR